MKRVMCTNPLWVYLAIAPFLGLSSNASARQETPDSSRQIRELQDRVRQLEQTVHQMKDRIESLERALEDKRISGRDKQEKHSPELQCANNLSMLWRMQNIYAARYGGPAKLMPAETGPEFWLKLSTGITPPLIDDSTLDVFVCPLSGEKARKGFTNYRGPAGDGNDSNLFGKSDPMACCELGCHADGSITVLYRNSVVAKASPGSPEYVRALQKTLGSPQGEALKRKFLDEVARGRCEHLIDSLTQAIKNYEIDHNTFPEPGSANVMKAVMSEGAHHLPYFDAPASMLNDKGEALDPWGRPLMYIKNYPPGGTGNNRFSFDLYSFGPDGKDDKGVGDDCNNWE